MDIKNILGRFKKRYSILCRSIKIQELPSDKYAKLAQNYKPEQLFTQFLKVINLSCRYILF